MVVKVFILYYYLLHFVNGLIVTDVVGDISSSVFRVQIILLYNSAFNAHFCTYIYNLTMLHSVVEYSRRREIIDVKLRLKCDGTRAETIFRLSARRTCPFKSAGASVQSTTGS